VGGPVTFEGHVTSLTPRDRPLLPHIDVKAMVGDAAQVRRQLSRLADAGYREVIYTPAGPDVARELRALAAAWLNARPADSPAWPTVTQHADYSNLSDQNLTKLLKARATGMLTPVIDPDSAVPPYEQVAKALRDEIAQGAMTGRIPSVHTIAEHHQVSHRVAARALEILQGEGMIENVPGEGHVVRHPRT
jgi:hypothetical protein